MTPSPGARRVRDVGSATVEFLLVSVLVVAVALGVIQLAIALHVRNILISSAHEGAQYAALADKSLDDGEARAEVLLHGSLGGVPANFAAQQTVIDGMPAVEMTVSARVPLIGMWGAGEQHITAHALAEVPRG
ncbi:TadE/TadG family type IV pilus assembly protein [Demequina oxidasica]|uniref:TadE/TadG family type IV pilus assembly protein n=1 Tax=Demequina oxidasica TaxID=676199 RepID=UPI000785F7F2|nr:TadE/TadG family type IV pilus assembly protein [Demequina oxidasica]